MNQEVKEKWLAALRSRKYKQGHNGLCMVDLFGNRYYCCLGVLTDLYAKEHQLEWMPYVSNYLKLLEQSCYLPKEVRDWSGLNEYCPMVEGHISLARLNDNGVSFDEIADKIEMYL